MSTTLLVIQHISHEGPGLIGQLAVDRGMCIQTIHVNRGESLPEPSTCRNCIALVLGGPMGVNQRDDPSMEWLRHELDWLSRWHQQKKPVLGICLGAQLLAVAAGGSVEPLKVGEPAAALKELGLGAIHWLVDPGEEPLLDGMESSAMVLHWHGDRIRLPQEATLLGSSLHCPEQVYKIGQHAIGLQCHLEVTESELEHWIEADRSYVVNAIGRNGPNQLLQDWKQVGKQIPRNGKHLFTNILSHLEALSRS